MTTDQDSPTKFTTPRCRKCHNPIDPRSEDDLLDKFGDFFRLRCTAVTCGHIDWYKGVSLVLAAELIGPAPQEPGEVWIHDVMLGLTVKADGLHGHDMG